jgi:hypothetical protein
MPEPVNAREYRTRTQENIGLASKSLLSNNRETLEETGGLMLMKTWVAETPIAAAGCSKPTSNYYMLDFLERELGRQKTKDSQ